MDQKELMERELELKKKLASIWNSHGPERAISPHEIVGHTTEVFDNQGKTEMFLHLTLSDTTSARAVLSAGEYLAIGALSNGVNSAKNQTHTALQNIQTSLGTVEVQAIPDELVNLLGYLNTTGMTSFTPQMVDNWSKWPIGNGQMQVKIRMKSGEELSHRFSMEEYSSIANKTGSTQRFRPGGRPRGVNFNPPAPATPRVPTIRPPEITLKNITTRPNPLPPQEDNSHVQSQSVALFCSCKDTFFCEHIDMLVAEGADQKYWWGRTPIQKWIEIAVPLFGFMFHRILIKRVFIEDWEGNKTEKIKARSMCLGDPAGYYDIPKNGKCGLMPAQHAILEETVMRTDVGLEAMGETQRFTGGGIQTNCSNARIGKHKPGHTADLLNFLRKPENPLDRVMANAFCIVNYGICYVCHLNEEPAYSLVQD